MADGRPGDLCRRSFTSKEEGEWLCKSSFFNYRTSATENKRVSSGCTGMASPMLMASAYPFANRSSALTAGLGGSSAPSGGQGQEEGYRGESSPVGSQEGLPRGRFFGGSYKGYVRSVGGIIYEIMNTAEGDGRLFAATRVAIDSIRHNLLS